MTPKEIREKARRMYKPIKPNWIIDKADKELPTYAEELGNELVQSGLTNSKIRSIYGEIKRIQIEDYKKCESSFFCFVQRWHMQQEERGKI